MKMNRPTALMKSIAVPLDTDTLALVEKLSASRNVSVAEFAAEAVRRIAESEADFDAFIQVGIDAADRGDLIPHEEVMAELDAMIAKHQARCLA